VLTLRTLPTFFRVLEVLVNAGVTTVAEAAFQDRLWSPHLHALRELADTTDGYRPRLAEIIAFVDAGR
jgi:hypothetical protein